MSAFHIINLQNWLELTDIENRKIATRTWIPLMIYDTQTEGEYNELGHRKEFASIESLIVPLSNKSKFKNADWESICHNSSHSGWANENRFIAPQEFLDVEEEAIATYPVLTQDFDTGEPRIWHLLQEIELSLSLLRKGDVWVRPIEDNIEVVRLRRDDNNLPISLEIRTEHLRDYLAARHSALLIGAIVLREATELKLDMITWENTRVSRVFERGKWEGSLNQINTGFPSGIELRMWHENVDPEDDVPVVPHPLEQPTLSSETTEFGGDGDMLEFAVGRIWWTEWIEPAEKSPRIRNDKVEAQVPFIVCNQGGPKLSGNKLKEYRGWLWFRKSVIRELLNRYNMSFQWHSHDTGSIGPSCVTKIHFGINDLQHVNVAAYQMAGLPEWVQQIWVAHNIAPEGGLSRELHQSQNLASPALSYPPEILIIKAIEFVQTATFKALGQPLFHNLPERSVLFQKIHRFQGDSFEQTCHLAKEISRYIVEKLDITLLNNQLSTENLKSADKDKIRSLKRLALLLDQLGHDGRGLTKALAGINDLRQGDAHVGSSSLKESFELFDITSESQDHYNNNLRIIYAVAKSLRDIAQAFQSRVEKSETRT